MLKKTDFLVLSYFRKNARCRLTTLSRKTGIPVSTLFDKLNEFEGGIVRKTVSLLNFSAIGFSTTANVLLKVRKDKEKLKQHLLKCPSVNSLYKINNGFDFLAECVFRSVKELEEFVESLKEGHSIGTAEVYYIVDELKREDFLSDPSYVDILVKEQGKAALL